MVLKFIITVGISGSGKSTWISGNKYKYNVVSPDKIREELTGDISNNTRNSEVFKIAFERIADSLNSGVSVIFDATNTVSKLRKEMLDKIKSMVNDDVDFVAMAKVFYCPKETCKARIKSDIDNNVNRSNVPDFVVDRQYNQFSSDVDKLESDGYLII